MKSAPRRTTKAVASMRRSAGCAQLPAAPSLSAATDTSSRDATRDTTGALAELSTTSASR
eukprot:4545291-Prorocentrum_lima.AAC.1